MPKLQNRPPKYCKMGKYAVVYHLGKPHYIGIYGSQESKVVYARLIAEIQANPTFIPSKEEKHVTVRELSAAFLDHAKANFDRTEYGHCRIIVLDFLDKRYGDNTPVDEFTPRGLKLVRGGCMRFCVSRSLKFHTCKFVDCCMTWNTNFPATENQWKAERIRTGMCHLNSSTSSPRNL